MSLWDQFELFSAADAASLAIPDNESETKALLNKMLDSYGKAVDEVFSKHFELTYPDSPVNLSKVRYHSIDDPLPEKLLYSRALDMHRQVLFRDNPSSASINLFQEWRSNETDKHYAFSCAFEVQKFDRAELHRWLTFHAIESAYCFLKPDSSSAPNPTNPLPLDTTVLATPDRLLRAFSQWGLKEDWFNAPRKQSWLLSARKQIGIGGNSSKPPLYCPFEVMQGLANRTKPRNGAVRMSEAKGWQILKKQFTSTYEKFEHYDPSRDQS